MSSKFHGPFWEGLVNDYGLRYHDIMTIRLEHYGTMIGVDFHHGGYMLFPLQCVLLEDLSESERELVDRQIYFTSRQLFDANYILCSRFVHRITSMNMNGRHMVILDMVVRSLKGFLSIPRTGSLTLEVTLDSQVDDIYVSIPYSYFIVLGGRMVFKKEGFGNFLWASSIEVNNLMLMTFKEPDEELVVIFTLLPH
ncbi:DNA topoisomerase 2 [Hordeum vulgare]|nr:DNA topoisomerase 2 [Hordeum vulgare]